ncbi:TolC family protein [Rhodopirellula bahusiensis]|uniref:TolC family protein n=1 Tax=Rhodopirellula bahusiensis TaxID=2014065 RepID=UPI001E47340C|nr:TolC family protein [Rhodopirellula bahusiensis]
MLLLAALGFTTGCQTVGQHFTQPTPRDYVPATNQTQVVQQPAAVRTVAFTDEGDADDLRVEDLNELDELGVELEDVASDDGGSANDPASLRDVMKLNATTETLANPPVIVDQYSYGFDQHAGLTLESIESMALGSHPAIAEVRARVESTRGQYVQAGLPFNPVLQYQSEEVGNEGASGLHSVQMSQQFVTANKLGIAQQVQAREIQKQQAELRIAELRVLTRVRAAFAAAVVAQERAEIADQIVELAEKSIESVNALLEAEEVSKIALLQARVEAEQARITAENAETQLQANLRTLAAAAGVQALPAGPLSGDVGDDLIAAPWEALLAEISASSPELARAGSELERAKWSLQLACAQVTPNVTATLGVGIDASSDDTFAVIGVSVPLPIRNRNQGNIRSARADIAAASAAMQNAQLSLEARLAEAVGRYQVALERYERLQESVVPTSEETYELSLEAFNAGETDFLQLLTAQRTLFTTQLNVLDAAGQAKQAAAEIEGLLVTLSL